jgi:hypothetical protein
MAVPTLLIGFLLCLGAALAISRLRLVRQFLRCWLPAAKRLGLRIGDREMSGSIGPYQISAVQVPRVTFSMGPGWSCPWDLVIRPVVQRANRNLGATTIGSAAHQPVRVGEVLFDERVAVHGAEPEVFALLGTEARALFRAFVENGGTLAWGKLVLTPDRCDEDGLVAAAELLCAVAATLDAGHGPAAATLLRKNVEEDPLPLVRGGSLRALAALHPASAELQRAVQAALRDARPELQFVAASLAPGESARETLRTLLQDPRLSPADRAMTLRALLHRFGYPDSQPLLSAAWDSPHEGLRVLALQAAGEAGDRTGFDRFCALTRSPHTATSAAATTALGKLGDPRAEPALLALLGHSAEEVRLAAVESLGRVGTIHAVEPLLGLTHGVLPARCAPPRALRCSWCRAGSAAPRQGSSRWRRCSSTRAR